MCNTTDSLDCHILGCVADVGGGCRRSLGARLVEPVWVRLSILEKLSAEAGLWMLSASRVIFAAAARAKSGSAGGTLRSVTTTLPPPPELELLARRLEEEDDREEDLLGELKEVLRPKEFLRSLMRTLGPEDCGWRGGGKKGDGCGGGWDWDFSGGSPEDVPGRDFEEEEEKKEEEKNGALAVVGGGPDRCMSLSWRGSLEAEPGPRSGSGSGSV